MDKIVTKSAPSEKKREPAVGYSFTPEIPALLSSLGASLLVSTYQAQRLMTLSSTAKGGLFMLMRVFERPTGIALKGTSMAAVTRREILFFENTGTMRDLEGKALPYDRCYSPRRTHVTGDISGHEAAWVKDELIVVNTRFSCLCTLDPKWSFVPSWHPPFISKVAPEDRCHLNGLVVDEKGPRFVSALAKSDQPEGWRSQRQDGGIIIDVRSGEIVTQGLSMPHSPRWYQNRLWILESGTGSLQTVDLESGKRTTVIELPGYLRGLSFFKQYAFVGLCKIRGDRDTFGGLEIEKKHSELKCAIYVLDLVRGAVVGIIEFTKGIEELFDVCVLPGVRSPHIIGYEEDTINGVFVIPS